IGGTDPPGHPAVPGSFSPQEASDRMKNDPATPNPESNDCPNTPAKGQGPPFEADGMNLGCRECSQPIPSARGQKKQTRFCSDECRLRFWRKRKASGFRQTSKTVAEIHRLMATAD